MCRMDEGDTENGDQLDEDASHEEARAAELEARYPSLLPSPGDRVFVKDTDPERKSLQDNLKAPHTDGYRWAAGILIEHVNRSRADIKRALIEQPDEMGLDPAHWLVYPIYFCFRQSIELSLKSLLEVQKAENRLPIDKEKLITTEHDLLKLWEPLEPWVSSKLRGLQEATASFNELLRQIHVEDKKGDAGRYALRKINGNLEPSFETDAPLSLEAVENTGVKMLNYIQRIWTAIEDEQRRVIEESSWAEED